MKSHAKNLNIPIQKFTVYAFDNDAPHTVYADCELAALEQAPLPCYIVVEYPASKPGQRFLAIAGIDSVFNTPSGHWANNAASAVATLKKHRSDIQGQQAGRRVGVIMNSTYRAGLQKKSLIITLKQENNSKLNINFILARLDKVRENGPRSWLACCPAHNDRSPSLAIREISNGTILMKCFAGCSAGDVIANIGLELKDLFPQNDRDNYQTSKRPGERWAPGDLLSAVAQEALLTLLAVEATRRGDILSRADLDRLATAAERLRSAAKEVGTNV